MAEMSNLENTVSLSMTITNSTHTTLRRLQPQMCLQKNYGFERCLWEENPRVSYNSVAPRSTSALHLLPLTSTIRVLLVANSVQGRKFFLYNLNDLVEGFDKSISLLALENAGLDILESFSQQQLQAFVKTISTQLYAVPTINAPYSVESKIRNVAVMVLIRVFFLLVLRQTVGANQLLEKLKHVLTVQLASTKLVSSQLSGSKVCNYARFLRRKRLEASQLILLPNSRYSRFLNSRLGRVLNASYFLKKFVWKRSSLFMSRDSVYNRIQHGYTYTGHRLALRESSHSFLYILRRLEDKYKSLLLTDPQAAKRIISARNYLIMLAEERMHRQRQTTLLLTRPSILRVIRRRLWRNLMADTLIRFAGRTSEGRAKIQTILPLISSFLTSTFSTESRGHNINTALSGDSKSSQKAITPQRSSWRRNLRSFRQPFVNKKIVEQDSAYSFTGYSDLISQLTGREVSVFFINALALTRFAFHGEGKVKSSQRFLQNIDREMVSRYKYVAVYIQDFVRVSFIALFLKKPTFLAQFIALQISKLPRNRKETKMLRFLIKVVKVFAAQRREVVGLRIAFKGRVNRWRRTKQIVGEKGILPLQSINTRIEFGSAKAITRKGTLGIRFWICYNPVFRRELRKSFLDYIEYSQQLRYRSLYRFLGRLQPRSFFEVK